MKMNQYMGQFLEVLDDMDKKAEATIKSGKKARRVPGLIIGAPGDGKTTEINMWAEFKGYNVTTITPSNYTLDDISGLDVMMNGGLERMTPSWFNQLAEMAKNGKRNVLFIDEISATNDLLQPPLFRLIFDRVLATKALPENTLIVAAGNLSEDLNNSFRMTAPLVNRFMILNITNDDISYREIIENEIDDMDHDEVAEFLGLTETSKKKYDFDKFREWYLDNLSEFRQGKSVITDDSEMGGLLGFISPRSVKYAMMFAEAYMGKFNDPIWMRIVGDTLGMSNKREGQPLRTVLQANESEFIRKVQIENTTFKGIRDEILMSGLTNEALVALGKLVENATLRNTTNQDLTYFGEIVSKYPASETLDYLSKKLIKKLS